MFQHIPSPSHLQMLLGSTHLQTSFVLDHSQTLQRIGCLGNHFSLHVLSSWVPKEIHISLVGFDLLKYFTFHL